MKDHKDACALAVHNATHHAVFLLDENGVILFWNIGAENIFGYSADEIIGCSANITFVEEDRASHQDAVEIEAAIRLGYAADDRWHLRKDGTRFWASGIMTPAYDEAGKLRGLLKIIRDKTTEKLASERSLYLARHDSLTGLANRSYFYEMLQAATTEAQINRSELQVLMLDLDRFKSINDTYGHHAGDLLLKEVARRLRDMVRCSDLVARLGGDEFAIIYRMADADASRTTMAEKVVQELSRPYFIEGTEVKSGTSVGVTRYPHDGEDPSQILKNADIAMYAAKSNGRSTYQFYTEELDADAKRRRIIADCLPKAFKHQLFSLHYQPQYALQDHRLVGVEALLRWTKCPVPDLSSPELIAIATEKGFAETLGEWTLRTACAQAQTWKTQGMTSVRIAVNISSGQLNAVSFLKLVDTVLRDTQVPPGCLDLEITEHMLMENNQGNDLLLKSLKKKGVYLSVDDFGTGFSSLSSLKTFPVDTLKIDREFVRNLPHSKHDAAIASSIVGLAHSLNLKVAAEGIEHQEQADFLIELGCDYGQGFLFGAPVAAEEIWQP